MSTRNTFRPASPENLEERVVLNGQMPTVHALAAHVAVTVGAMGDSYTDEYQFYPTARTHARNWVEQLSTAHKANFGAFTRSSRPEPRDQGFANDWARSDATSTDMVANQLPGLTAQVAAGKVNYAWIFVGGNDFIHYAEAVATNPSSQTLSVPVAIAAIEAHAASNIDTAVNTLLAANPNVKIVLTTIPSIGEIPLAKSLTTTPGGQALIAGIDQAVGVLNAQIASIAATNPRVALADLAAYSAGVAAAGATVPFGGTTINLVVPSNDYHSFFLADGLHLGSVGQGVIANTFINAIDTKFGATVRPFTATQIVHNARLIQTQTRRLPS